MNFLDLIPQHPIHIEETDERLEVYRLGTFLGTTYDLAGLYVGTYHPHIHDEVSSIIHIVAGKGVATIGDNQFPYEKGMIIPVPAGTSHGFEVEEETLLFTILDNPIAREDGPPDFRYAEPGE